MYYAAIRLYGAPTGTNLGYIISLHMDRKSADHALVREYTNGLMCTMPFRSDDLIVARVPQSYMKGETLSANDLERFVVLTTFATTKETNEHSPNRR